jgi:hypothetical protein
MKTSFDIYMALNDLVLSPSSREFLALGHNGLPRVTAFFFIPTKDKPRYRSNESGDISYPSSERVMLTHVNDDPPHYKVEFFFRDRIPNAEIPIVKLYSKEDVDQLVRDIHDFLVLGVLFPE